jgi:membrane-associated phospholipid phosphatase
LKYGTVTRVHSKGASKFLAASGRHILIALLLGGMIAGCYYFVDRPVAVWAHGLDPGIVAVWNKFTFMGSSGPYLSVLVPLYPVLRYYLRHQAAAKRVLFIIGSVVSTGVVINLVKPVVARWRPKALFFEPPQYGFAFFKIGYDYNSFPSGHATTALAVACALTLLYPRLRVVWVGAGVLVAANRVIVGSHYPGDVLAGGWFGVVITLALSRTTWFRGAFEATGGATQDQAGR